MADETVQAEGFWAYFTERQHKLAASLELLTEPGGWLASELRGELFEAVSRRIGEVHAGLHGEFRLSTRGAPILTISAGGDSALFPFVRAVARSAPDNNGWIVEGLIRRAKFEQVAAHFQGLIECARWAYSIQGDAIRLELMHDFQDMNKISQFQRYKDQFIMRLLGEDSFINGRPVVDVTSYENWLEAVPGGRSFPLCELATGYGSLCQSRSLQLSRQLSRQSSGQLSRQDMDAA